MTTTVKITDKTQIAIVREISNAETNLKTKFDAIKAKADSDVKAVQAAAKAEWDKINAEADAMIKEDFVRLRNALGATVDFVNPRLDVSYLEHDVAFLTHGAETVLDKAENEVGKVVHNIKDAVKKH